MDAKNKTARSDINDSSKFPKDGRVVMYPVKNGWYVGRMTSVGVKGTRFVDKAKAEKFGRKEADRTGVPFDVCPMDAS